MLKSTFGNLVTPLTSKALLLTRVLTRVMLIILNVLLQYLSYKYPRSGTFGGH